MTVIDVSGGSLVGDVTSAAEIQSCMRKKFDDWPLQTTLSAALLQGDTTVSFASDTNIAIGKSVTIDDETILITSGTASPWGCLRQHKGSEPAGHANTTRAYLSLRFTTAQMLQAIDDVVDNDLPGRVWNKLTTTITPLTTTSLYALPDDFIDVIALTQPDSTGLDYTTLGHQIVDVPDVISTNFRAIRVTFNGTDDAVLAYRGLVTTDTIPAQFGGVVCSGACAKLVGDKTFPRTAPDTKDVGKSSTLDLSRAWQRARQAEFDRGVAGWAHYLYRTARPRTVYRR